MEAISYAYADKQAKRISKFINEPDSTSGIVTTPKVIAAGETVTIPAGRMAVLPNLQIDGTLTLESGADVFIPSGATFGDLSSQISTINANVALKAPLTSPNLTGKITSTDITVNVTSGTYTSSANVITVVLTVPSHTVAVGDYINVKGITNTQASTGGSNVQFNGYQKVTAQTATTVTYTIATLLGTVTSTALTGTITFTNGGLYLDSLPKIKTAAGYLPLQGATAWVYWDNTTTPPTILASYRIPSLVRIAAGNTDIYFEELMDTANYCAIYSSYSNISRVAAFTTSKITTVSGYTSDFNGNMVAQNIQWNCVAIFGGKN